MPFTLAHPAAILPFAKTKLPLSALVIGAMVPDFEYMLRLSAQSDISHTLRGLFLFCIPAGVVALWIFHRILKLPLFALLPGKIQSRLDPLVDGFPFAPIARFSLIVAGIVLGAVTHLFWDSITHPDGWMVMHIPLLQRPALATQFGSPHVFRILQHASTLFGLGALLAAYSKWHRAAPSRSVDDSFKTPAHQRVRIVSLIISISVLLAFIFAAMRAGLPDDFSSIRRFVVLATIAGLDALIVTGSCYAVIWYMSADARRASNFQ